MNIGVVIVLLLIEIIAALWYSISYIPFARKIVGAYLRRQAICAPCFAVYDEVQAKVNPNQGAAVFTGTKTKKGFTFLQESDEP